MKITVNIDCTPEEARKFLGLPDVKPMQDALMKDLEERMRANLSALDPETMFNTWFPAGVQGFEQLQKMFWNQMSGQMSGMSGDEGQAKTTKKDETK
jgi:hypothetical protein